MCRKSVYFLLECHQSVKLFTKISTDDESGQSEDRIKQEKFRNAHVQSNCIIPCFYNDCLVQKKIVITTTLGLIFLLDDLRDFRFQI